MVSALLFEAGADVVQDVHEIDIAVVGAFVGAEIFVDVTVGPVFGAHVVEVVGGGELQRTPSAIALKATKYNHNRAGNHRERSSPIIPEIKSFLNSTNSS